MDFQDPNDKKQPVPAAKQEPKPAPKQEVKPDPKKEAKEKATKNLSKNIGKQETKNTDNKVTKAKDSIRDLLIKNQANIAMALPKHLPVKKLIGLATTTLSTNPALLECTQTSLIGSIIQAAQLGLELNKSLGHVYLVPYGKICTLIVGYQGLVELSIRTGRVSYVKAAVVREGDDFSYEYGLKQDLRHKPKGATGKTTHFYAYAKMKDGEHVFDVMEASEVDKIRNRAKSQNIWKSDYEEMGKKTVIRRLSKSLPKSVEFARGVELDGTHPEPADMDISNINPDSGQFEDKRDVPEAEVVE